MKHIFYFGIIGFMLHAPVYAQEHLCAPEGIRVGGYDLVSYREPGGPVMGTGEFEATHDGARYRFFSSENRDRFLRNPKDFLPRYSGFCAATLAAGRLVCPDYTNYKIEHGELLLFELAGFTNGRTLWNSDPVGYRERADANALILLER